MGSARDKIRDDCEAGDCMGYWRILTPCFEDRCMYVGAKVLRNYFVMAICIIRILLFQSFSLIVWSWVEDGWL